MTWDAIFASRQWGQYPGEDVIRFVKGNFTKGDRVLDAGCGPGANLWLLAREGISAHGVDSSARAIEQAQARMNAEGLRANLHCADFQSIPYPSNSFNGALDIASIACCAAQDARQAYAELARVTQPGGKLFARMFEQGCTPIEGCGHIRYTKDSEVPDLLQGWEVDRIERSSFTDRGRDIRHLLVYGVKA